MLVALTELSFDHSMLVAAVEPTVLVVVAVVVVDGPVVAELEVGLATAPVERLVVGEFQRKIEAPVAEEAPLVDLTGKNEVCRPAQLD